MDEETAQEARDLIFPSKLYLHDEGGEIVWDEIKPEDGGKMYVRASIVSELISGISDEHNMPPNALLALKLLMMMIEREGAKYE